MKEIKRKENNKGVTLIALIATVILIFIIVAVGVSSGMKTANSIEIAKFNDEFKLVQARVDVIYEQLKSGEKTEADFGGDTYTEKQSIMDRTFNDLNDTEINRGDYKYYTKQSIENYLGIEDVDQSVLINWKTRDVISVEGIEINGVRHYRYEGWHKPNYSANEAKDITIIPTIEKNRDIRKVIISVKDSDNKEISDFTLKYKLEGETTWKIADYDYFETGIIGRYQVQVSGTGINYNEKIISLYELEGYQQVEYIESTSNQYLEIDYIASNNTNSEGVFQITDTSTACMLFGSRVSSTNRAYSLNWGGGEPYKFYNTYGSGTVTSTQIDTDKHSFRKRGLDLYLDNTLIDTHTAVDNFITPHNMIVFGCNTNGTIGLFASAKIYSLQFYEGEMLSLNLIPCCRESDDEIGMYDLVNSVFYENKGTEEFITGENL